jgi:hypothetical protein
MRTLYVLAISIVHSESARDSQREGSHGPTEWGRGRDPRGRLDQRRLSSGIFRLNPMAERSARIGLRWMVASSRLVKLVLIML